MDQSTRYSQIWAVDYEFRQPPGERPVPVCLVAQELRSRRHVRVWGDELPTLQRPPYPIDETTLVVAYYASAEMGCHLALDWPMPVHILDLYAEFRCLTSGIQVPQGYGLLGALEYFGLGGIHPDEKDSMRELIGRGGPYTTAEQQAVLDYCQTDVDAQG